MNPFIDVTPDTWFFKPIDELYWCRDVDSRPFFAGIDYATFVAGKEAADILVSVTTAGQTEFILNKSITPTTDTPLTIYVDNVVVGYDECKPDQPTAGQTYVRLKRGCSAGAQVRFFYAGEPAYVADDPLMRPMGLAGSTGTAEFPNALIVLDTGYTYVYEPYNSYGYERFFFDGMQLRRVNSKDLIERLEDYAIQDGKIYVNGSLNNCSITGVILEKDTTTGQYSTKYLSLTPHSDLLVYHNRFFPETKVTRAETIVVANKIRKLVYTKYSDMPAPDNNKTSSRFADVQSKLIAGETPWYWEYLRNVEDMQLSDGSYVLTGTGVNWLDAEKGVTRAQMAEFTDKLRMWCIEAFK
jgi:hypothetical protein